MGGRNTRRAFAALRKRAVLCDMRRCDVHDSYMPYAAPLLCSPAAVLSGRGSASGRERLLLHEQRSL